MDSRSFMAPTSSPDLSAGVAANGDPSYPLYRYPSNPSGYPGVHPPSNAPFPAQRSVSVDAFNKGQKYPTGAMRSPLNASPASSAYSPPAQFRGTPNGSAFGGYGSGFYGGSQQPTPTSEQLAQQVIPPPERHASSGSNNTSESNSYAGGGAGSGGGSFSGPLQQDIHAN